MNKKEQYQKLINEKNKCNLCTEFINPRITNVLNPYQFWYGDLDADILLLAQDWGPLLPSDDFNKTPAKFPRYSNEVSKLCPTDTNMFNLLFYSKILSIKNNIIKSNYKLYFSNAFLCLRPGNKGSATATDPKQSNYRTCAYFFLKRLISIIEPKVIITLGVAALDGLLYAYDKEKKLKLPFILMMENYADNNITVDKARVFPFFHCSPLATRWRSTEKQEKDWQHLTDYLQGPSKNVGSPTLRPDFTKMSTDDLLELAKQHKCDPSYWEKYKNKGIRRMRLIMALKASWK